MSRIKIRIVTTFAAPRRRARPRRVLSWAVPPEVLEARKLMAFTDVAQLAATYAPHAGPTDLFLNFDGGTVPIDPVNNPNGASKTVRSFETEAGDTGLDRNRDIQDLLFQVAEVYAPFNVQVHRITGAGNYATGNGATTVFVGGDSSNVTSSTSPRGVTTTTKFTYGVTPGPDLDDARGSHVINTDPYDVAFVDPVQGQVTGAANLLAAERTERNGGAVFLYDIRRSIIHEAAHTFGLDHVRTDGLADPAPLGVGKVNDAQAYDTAGRNDFFANQSLNLTNNNNSGTSTGPTGTLPSYIDTTGGRPVRQTLTTQNSYLTLAETLGARPRDQYANVADASTVEPLYTLLGGFGLGPGAAPKPDLSRVQSQSGRITRLGDEHVFTVTPPATGAAAERVSIAATTGNLRPVLLVYDATGATLQYYADTASTGTSSVDLPVGKTYQVVVASHDGNTTGGYTLTLGSAINNPVLSSPITATTTVGTHPQSSTVPPITATTTIGVNGLPLGTTTGTITINNPVVIPLPPSSKHPSLNTTGPPIFVFPQS